MTKPISWFEIPAENFDRARKFYEEVFQVSLAVGQMPEGMVGVFPYDREIATGGCIQAGTGLQPVTEGTVVYLDASPSLDALLARVIPAGGRILQERTALPGAMGCFAHLMDTEGNRVGVHSLL